MDSKCDFLLDSGAWSAYLQKKQVDIEKYMEFIHKFKYLLTAYINLDVIDKGEESFQNWMTMRAEGLEPMPVWHVYTPERYLWRYCRKSEYVGIGDVAQMPTQSRVATFNRLWPELLKTGVKFHGLGVTTPKLMANYPWYSVDSTSWVLYGKYGMIILPYPNKPLQHGTVSVFVSPRSKSRREVSGKHFSALTPSMKEYVLDYIEKKGFKMGFGEIREVPDNYKLKGERERWAGRDYEENFPILDGCMCKSPKKVRLVETVYEDGLTTSYMMRDTLNLIYYLDLAKEIGLEKMYLAGNFAALKLVEIEWYYHAYCLKYTGRYNRLISFFHDPSIQNVLDLKRKERGEELHASKTGRSIVNPYSGKAWIKQQGLC